MFLPAFLFDIFCSRVAKEFILGNTSSIDGYAKKYGEGVSEEYAEVSEALYVGAASEIMQFLSEIEAGEDSVFYLDSFAYNRLYFSNINVERKMKPLFGTILDPMKEEEYKADVTVKNFKAFVFNLRSDPSKKAPAGWEITEDEHLAKFKELFEKTVSIFDDI
ncbi:MAG: hypothetical protein ACJZ4P_01765 [Candidatus Micropelagos sp.]|tara:strand:- start:189 stop:677 length:489 start_codon:yes stop_codon:yes gene_type:complete